jgi:hypothetical protein
MDLGDHCHLLFYSAFTSSASGAHWSICFPWNISFRSDFIKSTGTRRIGSCAISYSHRHVRDHSVSTGLVDGMSQSNLLPGLN